MHAQIRHRRERAGRVQPPKAELRLRASTRGREGIIPQLITFMDSHAEARIEELKVYPPPKPDSRYVRTGDYGRGFSHNPTRLSGGALRKDVWNIMRYSGWVGGDERGQGQQEQHRTTGWQLIATVLRRGYREGIRRVVREALR